MTQSQRIKALAEVTHLRLQVDQAKLAELQAKETALRKNLHDLVVQRRNQTLIVGKGDDPASIAGVGLQWHLWVDQRRRAINAELTLLFAHRAECQAKLRRSFGQDQAARALCKKAQAREKKMRLDRASYES